MAMTDDTRTSLLKLVRYASERAAVSVTKRDAAVREAHRAGASLRDIAAESGMSHMTIQRIIQRELDA
jgi:DNA-binding NarL/FixJ family response regulator